MNRFLVNILAAVNGLTAIIIIVGCVFWSLGHYQVMLNDPHGRGLVVALVGLVVGLVLAGIVCGILAIALSIEQSLRTIADKSDWPHSQAPSRVAEPRL